MALALTYMGNAQRKVVALAVALRPTVRVCGAEAADEDPATGIGAWESCAIC